MAYPEIYLNLNYNQKVIFSLVVIMLVIICQIIAKIKNKKRKKIIRKITRPSYKFDIYEFITSGMTQEFIGHKKMLINELCRI